MCKKFLINNYLFSVFCDAGVKREQFPFLLRIPGGQRTGHPGRRGLCALVSGQRGLQWVHRDGQQSGVPLPSQSDGGTVD